MRAYGIVLVAKSATPLKSASIKNPFARKRNHAFFNLFEIIGIVVIY